MVRRLWTVCWSGPVGCSSGLGCCRPGMVVYFVLAMCLFSGQGYEEVVRLLTEGLRGWRGEWTVPSTAAIWKARLRLGVEPLKELFAQVCQAGGDDLAAAPREYAAGQLPQYMVPGWGPVGLVLQRRFVTVSWLCVQCGGCC